MKLLRYFKEAEFFCPFYMLLDDKTFLHFFLTRIRKYFLLFSLRILLLI
jgi:hypothetical protein